jgi:hypothetical protein
MSTRSLVAVGSGWVFGLVAYLVSVATLGRIPCPVDDDYMAYLETKGYAVDNLICPNIYSGVRPYLALALFSLLMILTGYLVARIARRDEMFHSVLSVALAAQGHIWLLLSSSSRVPDLPERVVFFSTAAILAAALGGHLAKRRHA